MDGVSAGLGAGLDGSRVAHDAVSWPRSLRPAGFSCTKNVEKPVGGTASWNDSVYGRAPAGEAEGQPEG